MSLTLHGDRSGNYLLLDFNTFQLFEWIPTVHFQYQFRDRDWNYYDGILHKEIETGGHIIYLSGRVKSERREGKWEMKSPLKDLY